MHFAPLLYHLKEGSFKGPRRKNKLLIFLFCGQLLHYGILLVVIAVIGAIHESETNKDSQCSIVHINHNGPFSYIRISTTLKKVKNLIYFYCNTCNKEDSITVTPDDCMSMLLSQYTCTFILTPFHIVYRI